MSEFENCRKDRQSCQMPDGAMPFVIYGYPLTGQIPMPYPESSQGGCGMYGTSFSYIPNREVMNPVFFRPYQSPGCGCRASDLDD